MNVIVCIKQVPGTTEVRIDPQRGTLIREGVEVAVNPFDMYAVEEGIRIKEREGGKVILISMGPPQAESALREALALGCDEAILLSDRAFAGADTLATAYTLACAIRKIDSYDLIICGVKTTDGDTGQVGPGLAEELGIPHVSYVRSIQEIGEGYLEVGRLLEDGEETLRVPLPCLITVVKEINQPRLPSFRGKAEARKVSIPIWRAEDLDGDAKRFGLDGSPTQVVRVFPPACHSEGEMIPGDALTQAEKLIQKLRESKTI